MESPAPEILLMGGSGFVGSIVAERFVSLGWRVRLLTRTIRPYQPSFPCKQYVWDGKSITTEAIEGVRAVINLAGQPIVDDAWTEPMQQLILSSRYDAGRALAASLASMAVKPDVVIQISGTDFYGMEPRGEVCDEGSAPGQDFMSRVGLAHEEPTREFPPDVRVCIARMGLVLGWEGGGLSQLWDVYASGVGVSVGNGQQWMNWVHVDDVASFCVQAVGDERFSGIYNLVAPGNATNREFHNQLCEHTPSFGFARVPKLYLNLIMGERGNFMSQAPKVSTPRAIDHGFTYQYPTLESGLGHLVSERTYPRAHCVKVKQWLPLSASQWPLNPEVSEVASRGLYRRWHHQQVVHPVDDGVLIEDLVEYQLPLFPLGEIAMRFARSRVQARCLRRRQQIAKLALEGPSGQSSLPPVS